MDAIAPGARGIDPVERETMWRVGWRLMPLLMAGFFCAALDRANVGMAALTMNKQLGFSAAVFGFGAGVFFLGYFLAEIPSNLILHKVGARRWFARILITWGIVSGMTAFAWNDWSFYTVRFVLGVAEAGFFPGALLYLTWWFPSYYRTRMQGIFLSANMGALVIGPPIGGLLMQMDGIAGLFGWQWLFIIEAVPTVILSVVMWQLLTDRPADATWLAENQRTWLVERLASERTQREAVRKYTLIEGLLDPKVLLITLAYFTHQMSNYGLTFFMPLIVRGLGVPSGLIGLVAAIPFVFAIVAMVSWSWHSDLTGDRVGHACWAWVLCGSGLAVCILLGGSHPALTMVALTLASMGLWSSQPAFWALPSALLTGTASAGGLAMVSSVGSLGGWLGPSLFGLIKDATGGNDNIALFCLALAPVISIIAVLTVGFDKRLERHPGRS